MIEFLKSAFGAEEIAVYYAGPKGPVVHAKIRIGDSVLELGEAHGIYQPMSTMFYLYVNDVDGWYKLSGGRRGHFEGRTSRPVLWRSDSWQ